MTPRSPDSAWSTAFRRTGQGRETWNVRPAAHERVLDALGQTGLPCVTLSPLFDDLTHAWPLLNGLLVWTDRYSFGGTRRVLTVYGRNSMRVLCDLLALDPPQPGAGSAGEPPMATLRGALAVQQRLPSEHVLRWTRTALMSGTETMRVAAALLGEPEATPPPLAIAGRGPSRYYVTPTMTVDHRRGLDLPPEAAVALINVGLGIELDGEATARAALAYLGLNGDEIDSAIRFGQTGRV